MLIVFNLHMYDVRNNSIAPRKKQRFISNYCVEIDLDKFGQRNSCHGSSAKGTAVSTHPLTKFMFHVYLK